MLRTPRERTAYLTGTHPVCHFSLTLGKMLGEGRDIQRWRVVVEALLEAQMRDWSIRSFVRVLERDLLFGLRVQS